ncbi:MAG TPA: helix-turn-helix domain-containing protein [Pseudonocardiaceae bacterium]|nr:helix-turn-helix domain-containing protein [Pseudonocardiaceae bacterium]
MSGTARRGAGRPRTAESLAGSVLLRVPAVTDALVHVIHAQNPAYRELNSVPDDDLWQSCHDNITRVVQMIAGVDSSFDAAHATGQRRAEQGMPLDDVLRSFRLGGRLVWEALTDEARAQGIVDLDVLLQVASKVWEVVDSTSAEVAIAYHTTERHLFRADEQRKASLWEGLLHGRAKDPAFAYEVARSLALPVDGPYAVLAVDDVADADRTATRLGRRLAAARICAAWQVRAHTVVGLLALGATTVDDVLDLLRDRVSAPAGLSGVVAGLAEVDTAFRQATLARHTLPAGQVGVVALAERLPEALLVSSPDLAAQLIGAWLAPLSTLPALEREQLLETLRMWVRAAGSVRRTAELAHCHRNTVLNRMHRIQQIVGRDLTDAAVQVEIGLALRAIRLFPPEPD